PEVGGSLREWRICRAPERPIGAELKTERVAVRRLPVEQGVTDEPNVERQDDSEIPDEVVIPCISGNGGSEQDESRKAGEKEENRSPSIGRARPECCRPEQHGAQYEDRSEKHNGIKRLCEALQGNQKGKNEGADRYEHSAPVRKKCGQNQPKGERPPSLPAIS